MCGVDWEAEVALAKERVGGKDDGVAIDGSCQEC